ncbi:MAG: ribosome-associated translation inhibitor RaiA [Candidatus Staskawiczbacteria bacterium]|jgi:ribosomal subunit interface protein
MKIIIKAKNLELTGEMQNFIEKKFFGLKKFIDILKREDEIGKTLAEVFIEVEKETEHHRKGDIFRVKSRVYLPGREIVSWARTDDLQKAIVKAKDELKLEIEKYKVKKIDKNRRIQKKSKTENYGSN